MPRNDCRKNRCLARSTIKSSPGKFDVLAVRTCNNPTPLEPTWPVSLVPNSMRCGCPSASSPIRRLKNGWTRNELLPREIEERDSLEKKSALFRKQQRKAREVDLPLVDFGLREVRVDGEVQLQLR